MGFSFKKTFKSIAKPIANVTVKPATQLTKKTLDATGVQKFTKNNLGIDLNNIADVGNDIAHLQGSTGSDKFKNAAFDSAKIAAIAAGGAGAITASQAGGAFLLASKAQAGGGVSVGDLAAAGGYDTSFGGIDFGNSNVIKPKRKQSIFESFPSSVDEVYQEAISPKNRNNVYIAGGVFALIAIIFIARKIIK